MPSIRSYQCHPSVSIGNLYCTCRLNFVTVFRLFFFKSQQDLENFIEITLNKPVWNVPKNISSPRRFVFQSGQRANELQWLKF